MNFIQLDTPCLIIDKQIMEKNLKRMQDYADSAGVSLRPHTKTHKTPALALRQKELGACGITVAKVSEAEEMEKSGIDDIFIANEIVGTEKLKRIAFLSDRIRISFGLDSIEQADIVERCFTDVNRTAEVLIEIEVGENRSGIIEETDFLALLSHLKTCPHIHLKGVFSHDGCSYKAKDRIACHEICIEAQKRTLHFANLAQTHGFQVEVVSIGSTPPLVSGAPILPGITEIRPGTYIFMDAAQAAALGDDSCCAASVLAQVISRPTDERVILDVGAKGLTMQRRSEGICSVSGLGSLKDYPGVYIEQMYDEHAIIYNRDFRRQVRVGDKVRIIPVHICPVVNLYHKAYIIDENGEVTGELSIDCQGKLQ